MNTPTPGFNDQITPLEIQLAPVPVISNFFEPKFNLGRSLHIYSVAITPEVSNDNRRTRGRLFHSIEAQLNKTIGAHVPSGLNVFAANEVRQPVVLNIENETQPFEVTLNYSHKVDLANVTELQEVSLVLNVILKRVLRALGLKQVTRLPKFYDEQHTQSLPDLFLEIWRGYTAQISVYAGGPLLNIDFSSKIIYTRTLLDELMYYHGLGGDWKQQASAHLEGRIVMAKYGNRRCYKLDEIVYTKSPMDQLSPTDPRTFLEYFQRQYEERISNPSQPLLRSRARRRGEEQDLYLVPELVTLTGLDQEMRSNFKTMSQIATVTRLEPEERLKVSKTLAELISTKREALDIMESFEIAINPTPLTVNSYDISGEAVYTDGLSVHPVDDAGGFQIRGKILASVPLRNWVVIAPKQLLPQAQVFVNALFSKLSDLDSAIMQPKAFVYSNEDPLESVVTSALRDETLQFLVVLLTKRLKTAYPALKRLTSTVYPVPSQVVVIPVVEKRAMAITEKVAMQIQAKLGAQLWTVKPVTAFGKFVMIVGIDIFHDIVNRKKSVLGFCATVHPNFSKYYSTTSMQETGQEIATAIGQLLLEAIHVFREKARRCPETIIFFRDGVAESQTDTVRQFEVDSVLRACRQVDQTYSPEVIYTVVVKETSAKFFSNNCSRTRSARGVGNLRPGTLITEDVVRKTGDFYLVSHFANQGISSPSLYRTLYVSHPESFQLEALARLAYKLCHMYYNWTGAVKVPAPCMMAHKIAYFVGQCVHENVNQVIRTLAFYL